MNQKYCFMIKKENGPVQFLCQTPLDEERFAFHWEVGETLTDTKNIFVFDRINPKQINPVIENSLSLGFKCWLLEIPTDPEKIKRTKMIPVTEVKSYDY